MLACGGNFEQFKELVCQLRLSPSKRIKTCNLFELILLCMYIKKSQGRTQDIFPRAILARRARENFLSAPGKFLTAPPIFAFYL